jgi:hypothetical protein
MSQARDVQAAVQYFTVNGQPTPEGLAYFAELIAYIRALEARIEALEAP